MRTTLILQDELVAEARRRAAESRQSLSAIVNEALREALREPVSREAPAAFALPTFRPAAAGTRDTSPAELQALWAAEEGAPYRT